MKIDRDMFPGVIKLPYFKILTSEKKISRLDQPERVTVSLKQHIGEPCTPLVEVGDRVELGQKIGEPEGDVSAAVHAPYSGEVLDIKKHPIDVGEEADCVIIKVAEEQPDKFTEQVRDPEELTAEEIIEIVQQSGIVGMGGAAFPTPVKLQPPKGKTIETVLVNGAECEPYLTVDHRLMLEKAEELIEGTKLLLKASGAEEAMIYTEDNKLDALKIMEEANDDPRICVDTVPTKYPQGSEKMLIQAALNKQVPSGGLPFDIGVLVQNIGTTIAIYEAVVYDKPLIERVITVSGQNIAEPGNHMIPIGTPVSHVLEQCGGIKSDNSTLVLNGGPMMGVAMDDFSIPVMKGTIGLLAIPASMEKTKKMRPCVRCNKCNEACPVLIYPSYLSVCIEEGRLEEAAEVWDIFDCIECGICSYVCMSHRPIAQQIREAKQQIKVIREQAAEGGNN